jgi:formylglycine-generating enzyme required for sulfatase activity
MDMAGNVWEWTASEHQGIFMHVLRGGSWREYSNYAMRTTARSWVLLGEMRDDLGFRLTK